MKLYFLFFAFLLYSGDLFLKAQTPRTIQPPTASATGRFVNHPNSTFQNQAPPVFLDPQKVVREHKWDVSLFQFGIDHESEIPKTRMDSIKLEGRRLRQQSDSLFQAQGYYRYEDTEQVEGNHMMTTVYLNNSFKGNKYDAWAPPDNNLAVSDAGHLVSVINNSILMMDVTGNILLEENFEDFFAPLQLNGGYFDPKVLYDPDEDKFIVVVLNGNTPATSTVVVGFSTSNDPTAGWWMYGINGDPAGNNLWFDYPSIAISTDDLYISGNQYTEDRQFSQVVIYQLGKAPGYLGLDLEGVHYVDIKDGHGNIDFNIVPISYGFDGTIGPGIYMISTDGAGGSEATLYYVDSNAQSNPTIYAYSAPITNYYTPFDGLMLGTNDELETNDCRTLSGFYADGTVHFVFNTRGDDFHTKVYYCRLKIEDLSTTSVRFGLQPFEYAYPSIAPFATEETDKSVLIGFLRTGGTIYPEFRMMAVDHHMNYEGSHLVKAGKSYVNATGQTTERWGDYSGISRRHSATGPEVWISGCYGEDQDNGGTNVLSTWIGQVTDVQTAVTASDTLYDKFLLFPNPVSTGKVNVEFEMTSATELDFLVIDDQGRVIKNLMHRMVKAGLNYLSFQTDPLSPGMYFLLIRNKQNSLIKSEKFIVAE